MKSVRKWNMNGAKMNTRRKNKLTELYDLQKQTREKALQYAKSRFNEIYRLGCHLKETLAKYVFDETNEPEEPAEQEPNAPNIQEEVLGTKQTEYFPQYGTAFAPFM